MSNDPTSLMSEARQAESEGRFLDSELLYRQVLTLRPTHREAFLYHSLTLVRLGRAKEAISQLKQLVSADPKCLIALNWLSKLQRESGRIQSALTFSEKAIQVSPRDLETIYNLGLCYLGLSRFEEAILCFERSTALTSRFGPGYYALACAYEAIGQPWPALLAIKKNVEIDPNPPGFLKLAQLYLAVGNTGKALEFGLKAAEGLQDASVYMVLAESYTDSDPDLANRHYESAVQLDPSLETVIENNRAKRLSRVGRLEEARDLNAKIRDGESSSGTAYLNWVTIKKIDSDDAPILERMIHLLDDRSLLWEDRCALYYALGKSFDDLGDYESAIRHYDEANKLKRANLPSLASFDRQAFAARIDSTIELFSREQLATWAPFGNPSDRPIFIVGMMRTGTTLMEQILSRHPQVVAGGELAHWPFSVKKIIDFGNKLINRPNLLACAESYLELLDTISPGADRVTDKNPANLLELGLIHLAYPNAHIIQMARDPIDTAISVYITPTRQPADFGCDRENIVFSMQQTERLEAHWQQVLPEEIYHLVRYEDLVSNPETVISQVVSQCGLDPAKLELGSSRAQSLIGTPSLWQARQPITTSSIGRSKRYSAWLGAFNNLDY